MALARPDNPRLPEMRRALAAWQAEQRTVPAASEQLASDIADRRQRLAQADVDDPDRPVIESELGKLLGTRYQVTGAVEDLNESVEHSTLWGFKLCHSL